MSSAPPVLTLLPELQSVRLARQYVRTRCREEQAPSGVCEDAELLASELVTNAVLHGRSQLDVQVQRAGEALRVTVGDENSRRPVVVPPDPDALDGRGLVLVQTVARRWGVEERALGKAVWFELAAS